MQAHGNLAAMLSNAFLRLSFLSLIALAASSSAVSAEDAANPSASSPLKTRRGEWVNISESLLTNLARQGVQPKIKFKYDSTNGAGVCGILVDRSLPNPWIVIHGQGVWKPGGGAGIAFERVDGGKYDGYYENAGPDIDPEGRGLCLFSIQGWTTNSTCALTRDGGKTWNSLTTDDHAFGYDVGAVDWAGGGMTILAKKHHNGDLVLSRDGGQTWTLLGKGESKIAVLGLIGADVLIKGVKGTNSSELFRSTDAGQTWVKVADCQFNRIGHVVVFHGVAYLTTQTGVLVSRDRGEHWSLPGQECSGLRGPVMFGKDDQHLVVYGAGGFSESKDGGRTWTLAVSFGEDPALRTGRFEYGIWNPGDNSFYITHIAGQAFRYER